LYERYSLIAFAVAFVIIFLDLYLLRKGKIQGRNFFLWIVIGLLLGLFSGVPPFLSILSLFLGTETLFNAVLASGLLFFLLAIFYLSYRISEMNSLLMKLAIEVSAKKYGETEQSNLKNTSSEK
jgi:hypothetical protein